MMNLSKLDSIDKRLAKIEALMAELVELLKRLQAVRDA